MEGDEDIPPVTRPDFPSGHFSLACDFGEPGNHSTDWEGKGTGLRRETGFSLVEE